MVNMTPQLTSFLLAVDVATETRNGTVLSMGGLVLSLAAVVQLSWVIFLASVECRLDPKEATPHVRGGRGAQSACTLCQKYGVSNHFPP